MKPENVKVDMENAPPRHGSPSEWGKRQLQNYLATVLTNVYCDAEEVIINHNRPGNRAGSMMRSLKSFDDVRHHPNWRRQLELNGKAPKQLARRLNAQMEKVAALQIKLKQQSVDRMRAAIRAKQNDPKHKYYVVINGHIYGPVRKSTADNAHTTGRVPKKSFKRCLTEGKERVAKRWVW